MKSILKATKMCGWIVVILRSHFLDYAISPRIKTVKMGYFAIGGVVCFIGSCWVCFKTISVLL